MDAGGCRGWPNRGTGPFFSKNAACSVRFRRSDEIVKAPMLTGLLHLEFLTREISSHSISAVQMDSAFCKQSTVIRKDFCHEKRIDSGFGSHRRNGLR